MGTRIENLTMNLGWYKCSGSYIQYILATSQLLETGNCHPTSDHVQLHFNPVLNKKLQIPNPDFQYQYLFPSK